MLSFDMLGFGARSKGLRRLALVLASLQSLAYAGAPVAEAHADRRSQAVDIESSHSKSCTPLHQPDKCIFCQLGSVRARHCERVALEVGAQERRAVSAVPRPAAPQRIEARPTRSRAPPLVLA